MAVSILHVLVIHGILNRAAGEGLYSTPTTANVTADDYQDVTVKESPLNDTDIRTEVGTGGVLTQSTAYYVVSSLSSVTERLASPENSTTASEQTSSVITAAYGTSMFSSDDVGLNATPTTPFYYNGTPAETSPAFAETNSSMGSVDSIDGATIPWNYSLEGSTGFVSSSWDSTPPGGILSSGFLSSSFASPLLAELATSNSSTTPALLSPSSPPEVSTVPESHLVSPTQGTFYISSPPLDSLPSSIHSTDAVDAELTQTSSTEYLNSQLSVANLTVQHTAVMVESSAASLGENLTEERDLISTASAIMLTPTLRIEASQILWTNPPADSSLGAPPATEARPPDVTLMTSGFDLTSSLQLPATEWWPPTLTPSHPGETTTLGVMSSPSYATTNESIPASTAPDYSPETTSAPANATESGEQPVTRLDLTVQLVLNGNCSVLDRMKKADQLADFRIQIAQALSRELDLDEEQIRIEETRCGSIVVTIVLVNVTSSVNVSSLSADIGSNYLFNSTADNVTFAFYVISVQVVGDRPATAPPAAPSPASEWPPPLTDVQIVIIIICCVVGGTLLIFGVGFCVYACCQRKRTKSFDLGETPACDLGLDDFTLTKMQRPSLMYGEHGPVMPPPPPPRTNNGKAKRRGDRYQRVGDDDEMLCLDVNNVHFAGTLPARGLDPENGAAPSGDPEGRATTGFENPSFSSDDILDSGPETDQELPLDPETTRKHQQNAKSSNTNGHVTSESATSF